MEIRRVLRDNLIVLDLEVSVQPIYELSCYDYVIITQVASVLFNDKCNHSSNEKQNNLNLKPSGSHGMNRTWYTLGN